MAIKLYGEWIELTADECNWLVPIVPDGWMHSHCHPANTYLANIVKAMIAAGF